MFFSCVLKSKKIIYLYQRENKLLSLLCFNCNEMIFVHLLFFVVEKYVLCFLLDLHVHMYLKCTEYCLKFFYVCRRNMWQDICRRNVCRRNVPPAKCPLSKCLRNVCHPNVLVSFFLCNSAEVYHSSHLNFLESCFTQLLQCHLRKF